jgi:3-oxoadipate enol-lactonase
MNFFESSGVRLAYRVDGPEDAPPIVLVNSLGTDYRMWDQQIDFFEHSLRIIRYDVRGHGSSAVSPDAYTIEQLGLDLLALLDTLRVERAHICGLSLGGMVAQWCAATHPERVISLICANTAARIGTSAMWDARIDAIKAGGMGAIRDAVLARFFSEAFRQQQPEVTQRIGEMLAATSEQGYIDACVALREADLRGLLAAIHVPTLILTGTLDEATPPIQAHELHTAIAGSTLVMLHGAAHLSNIEQPEQFSKLVLTATRAL